MVRADETAPNLADLLALHRETIAASTAQQAQQIPGTRFPTLSLDDFRTTILRGIDALITDLRNHSDELWVQFAFDLGRRFVSLGFDISDVIQVMRCCSRKSSCRLSGGASNPGHTKRIRRSMNLTSMAAITLPSLGISTQK